MNASHYLRERRRLAAALRAAREEAGFSGARLADELGRSQPWISKIENAKSLIAEDDLARWAEVTRADLAHLAELHARAHREYSSWYDTLLVAGGAATRQAEVGALEATCVHYAEFQPALVPGLLQTAAYATDVIFAPGGPVAEGTDPDDAAALVGRRLQRQQVLWMATGSGKTHTFVMLAAALRTRVASDEAMRGQLAHLAALCEGGPSSLTIGIVPAHARVPIAPTSGFVLYDEDLVVVEAPDGGELQLSDVLTTTNYGRLLKLVIDVAVTGSEAAGECRRALADL